MFMLRPRLLNRASLAAIGLLALVTFAPARAAFPLPMELSAAELEFQGVRLEGVRLQTRGQEGIQLDIARVAPAGGTEIEASGLQLQCSQLGSAATGWCPGGEWQLLSLSPQQGWQQALEGTLLEAVWNAQRQALASRLVAGDFQAEIRYSGATTEGQANTGLTVDWGSQPLTVLPFRALLPSQLDWIKGGRSKGQLAVVFGEPPATATGASGQGFILPYRLEFSDVSFDSPDGLFAGEGLRFTAQGQLQPGSPALIQLDTRFQAGQLLLDRFYTEFGPQSLQLKTRLAVADGRVDVRDLQLNDSSSLRLQASASFMLDDPVASLRYQVQQLELQFPLAYERYLEPVLAAWTLDKLTVTGGFSWTGSGSGGKFPNGTLVFEDLSVVDHEQDRFAFTGMTAHIEAGNATGQSDFSWRGLLLGRINLGAGQVGIHTAPGLFELAEPLRLQVLGGELVVDEFGLQLPPADQQDADPVVTFNAGLQAMDMKQLTAALGWPSFDGKISGRIPGASYDRGVLTVDGVISFEAFDGRIQLSELKVERLFGVLPSFAADLEVEDLDLQQLTSAFSFGSIAGRLDGYVHNLRMLDWSPVSFDAWMGTPERQGDSRSISRRAVNNLTSIGGGGATAALTGPIMRLFSNFSYKRLGMGCKLENYICSVRGLADEADSVVIMEGSGIPKLSIRVFNRRMDWPQLVANLEAATSGGDIRIGDE